MTPELKTALAACRLDTVRFWDEHPRHDLAFYRAYIAQLLFREMALAEACRRLPDLTALPGGRCDILVILVGYSFEPLLQAMCAYQPREVIPVLNHEYAGGMSGRRMGQDLKRLAQALKEEGKPVGDLQFRETEPLADDTPSHVFGFLQSHLQGLWKTQSIVIDITGAKKSMVAGAFFFAAYSNIPISYVDSDVYDPERGRPYGCDCQIGLIANPYRDFHLRDWARVRRLYEQYAFAAARRELERVCGEMDRSSLCTPTQTAGARRLLEATELLEAWDNGDYHTAMTKADGLAGWLPAEGVPSAVTSLGDNWPFADLRSGASEASTQLLKIHLRLKHGEPGPEDSIFDHPKALAAYTEDEMAKIERLLTPKEEYRAAYLRAVGLDEFLWKARLALCWLHGDLLTERGPVTRSRMGSAEWRRWFSRLVEHDGGDDMRRALLHKGCLQMRSKGETISIRLGDGAPALECYWQGKELSWDQRFGGRSLLSKLRGEAIHTHLYLTEKIARGAVAVARAGMDELRRNWLHRYHPGTLAAAPPPFCEEPGWSQLCSWCGVDYLPPYLGGEEEQKRRGQDDKMASGR